jgi:hypothetical protein
MTAPIHRLTAFDLQRKVRTCYVLLSVLVVVEGHVANMLLEMFSFALDRT